MLGHVPDTGDRVTGRAVDDFVEQAADALRALDEAVATPCAPSGRSAGDRRVSRRPGVVLAAGRGVPVSTRRG